MHSLSLTFCGRLKGSCDIYAIPTVLSTIQIKNQKLLSTPLIMPLKNLYPITLWQTTHSSQNVIASANNKL